MAKTVVGIWDTFFPSIQTRFVTKPYSFKCSLVPIHFHLNLHGSTKFNSKHSAGVDKIDDIINTSKLVFWLPILFLCNIFQVQLSRTFKKWSLVWSEEERTEYWRCLSCSGLCCELGKQSLRRRQTKVSCSSQLSSENQTIYTLRIRKYHISVQSQGQDAHGRPHMPKHVFP